jgi:hypothetical protein
MTHQDNWNSRGRQDPGSVTGGVLRSYHGVLRVFFERLRRDLQCDMAELPADIFPICETSKVIWKSIPLPLIGLCNTDSPPCPKFNAGPIESLHSNDFSSTTITNVGAIAHYYTRYFTSEIIDALELHLAKGFATKRISERGKGEMAGYTAGYGDIPSLSLAKYVYISTIELYIAPPIMFGK